MVGWKSKAGKCGFYARGNDPLSLAKKGICMLMVIMPCSILTKLMNGKTYVTKYKRIS
jgi:hypothetical protein